MSNPRAKAERSRAKDARQGGTDQRGVGRKNKRDRTVVVEYKWTETGPLSRLFSCKDWRKFGAYRTEKEAQEVIEIMMRKRPYYEMRIRSES